MGQDKVISALFGLIGACNNNPKTVNTDNIVIQALSFVADCSDCDEKECQDIVEKIYREKNAVAPGCAACAMPCGNTSDYDMERIYNAKEGIRKVKLDILTGLKELASDISNISLDNNEINNDFFYKALSYISYDISEQELLVLVDEMKELKKKIGQKNIENFNM